MLMGFFYAYSDVTDHTFSVACERMIVVTQGKV